MSDPFDAETPSADEVQNAEETRDPAELQSAGDLDEEELGTDPLEGGMEPPQRWSSVSRDPPTPSDQFEADDLDERLAQQRPDTTAEEDTGSVGETRTVDLDESIDERASAEVADGVDADEYVDQPVAAEHSTVVGSEQTEETGRSASSVEGFDAEESRVVDENPEEDAERVEDSGR